MLEEKVLFKEKIKSFLTRKRIIKYVVILGVFLAWILFIDDYSLYNKRIIRNDIENLEKEKAYYLKEMQQDKEALKKLMQTDGIERYAREHYYMKRENEDVYLIEYKETTSENE